jgi:uncharacterized protein DUF4339
MASCPVCGRGIDRSADSCPSCGAALAVEAVSAVPLASARQSRWYVLRGDQRLGPYAWEQMKGMAAARQLHQRQHVWEEGTRDWVEAGTVTGLWPERDNVADETVDAEWDRRPAPGSNFFAVLWLHLRRAFGWTLAHIAVTESEQRTLRERGMDNAAAQSYLAWRRSIFLVVAIATGLSALLHIVTMSVEGFQNLTGFGVSLEVIGLLTKFAMPITATLAFVFWSRVRLSRWLMVLGWTVAFAVPVLSALFPLHWSVRLEQPEPGPGAEDFRRVAVAILQFVGGIVYFIMLMPAVLSILPGVLRACVRLKTLLPESIITGWFLIAATPFYALLLFVTFITINQIAGNPLLIVAVLLFCGAPLTYLGAAGLFTRPISQEVRKLATLQIIYTGIIALAIIFLLSYLFTGSFFGKRIMGFSREHALFMPWQLVELYIEFIGRSLFTSTLAADLFLLMNHSVWHHLRQFNETEDARRYDGMMDQLGTAMRRG